MTGRELYQSSSVTSGEGRDSRREQDYSSNLLPGSSRRGRTGIKVNKNQNQSISFQRVSRVTHRVLMVSFLCIRYSYKKGGSTQSECLSPCHPCAHNLVALARNCCKLSATDTDTHKSARGRMGKQLLRGRRKFNFNFPYSSSAPDSEANTSRTLFHCTPINNK